MPTCILTLDFHNTFDRISHALLFNILPQYGISPWFLERIRALCTNATPSVQINGTLVGPITIQSGVRQRCPLCKVLYALRLHPFFCALPANQEGLQFGLRRRCILVVAYAKNIAVFVTNPAEFKTIHQVIGSYERATEARLNPSKAKDVTVGDWTESATVLGIGLYDSAHILRVNTGPSVLRTVTQSWTDNILAVRVKAKQAYARNFCLAQRIQYVQHYLLAKIW